MARTRPVRKRKPSFFKVLIGDFSNQLQIPRGFYKHFDWKGPQQTYLRSLTKNWLVHVEKIDGKFFFRKGWKRFVHHHDLKLGEFLVFRYLGNSKFFVDIYGRNTCKKEFLRAVEKSEKHEHADEDNQGLKGVAEGTSTGHATNKIPIKEEVIDTEYETPLHPLARNTGKDVGIEKANTFRPEEGQIQASDHEDEDEDEDDDEAENEEEEEEEVEEEEDDDECFGTPNDIPSGPKTKEISPLGPVYNNRKKSSSKFDAYTGVKDVALQRAYAFKSEKPSFVVPMHSSYVHGGYLNVPSDFVKRYITKRPSEVILQVKGKYWGSVSFHCDRTIKRFTTGWTDFVRANRLEVGSACVFVLCDNEKFVFDVIFYNAK